MTAPRRRSSAPGPKVSSARRGRCRGCAGSRHRVRSGSAGPRRRGGCPDAARGRRAPARPPTPWCSGEDPEQQVLGADLGGAQPARLLLRSQHRLARGARDALEHQVLPARDRRPACCLWTACRLTRRASAICCQDQPCSRALSTCRSVSCSTSSRSEATARNPAAGSRLLAAAASVVVSRMASIHVDRSLLSTIVDEPTWTIGG